MAGKGPPPTPTNILKLRASWRADIRADEPQILPCIPDAPEWLPEDARADFERTARELDKSRLIGEIDAECLATLVYFRYRFHIGVAELEGSGHVIETMKGDIKVAPELKALIELANHIDKLSRLFGMSPSARAGLSPIMGKKQQKEGGLDSFRTKQA